MKSYKRTSEYKLKKAILASEDHAHHIGVDRWMDLVTHYGKVDQITRLLDQHAETRSNPRTDALRFFHVHGINASI